MWKRIALIIVVATSMGCAHLAPEATAPNVCQDCKWWPSNAWIMLQKDGEIVGRAEVEGFPYDALDVRFSDDSVAEVVGIRGPLFGSIYSAYRKLLDEHGLRLSERGFQRAMQRGQLTCHSPMISWPSGDDAIPVGRSCVNVLLFSFPPPDDPDHVFDSLDIMFNSDKDAMSAAQEVIAVRRDHPPGKSTAPGAAPETPPPGQIRSRVSPWAPDGTYHPELASDEPVHAHTESRLESSRLASWETVLEIIKAATKFNDVAGDGEKVKFGQNTCMENLPSEMVAKDPALTDAIVTAFVKYSKVPGGRDLIVRHAMADDLAGVWEDPCLPGELEEYLNAEKVYLLRNAGLKAIEAACQARRTP